MLRHSIIVVAVISVFICMIGKAWAYEYWVRPDGNDSNRGTGEGSFRMIEYKNFEKLL